MVKFKEIPLFDDHERFLSMIYIDLVSGCWLWRGYSQDDGTSRFVVIKNKERVPYSPKRISYDIFVGKPDDALLITPSCKNKFCLNPDHLQQENHASKALNTNGNNASINTYKESCFLGHPFDSGNTYVNPKGQRQCKICMRRRGISSDSKRIEKRKLTDQKRHLKNAILSQLQDLFLNDPT